VLRLVKETEEQRSIPVSFLRQLHMELFWDSTVNTPEKTILFLLIKVYKR